MPPNNNVRLTIQDLLINDKLKECKLPDTMSFQDYMVNDKFIQKIAVMLHGDKKYDCL